MSNLAVVAGAAGGVESIGRELVKPLVAHGHTVGVTLTPTAATWLEASGLIREIEDLTGFPVRSAPRLPSEESPHPRADVYVAAPLTASSVAKLALGIADNQALTSLCENVATTPMVVFPRVNAAHARQPAWRDTLRHCVRQACTLCMAKTCGPWPSHVPLPLVVPCHGRRSSGRRKRSSRPARPPH